MPRGLDARAGTNMVNLGKEVSMGMLAGISAALIGIATLLLVPEIKFAGRGKLKPALLEEVSD